MQAIGNRRRSNSPERNAQMNNKRIKQLDALEKDLLKIQAENDAKLAPIRELSLRSIVDNLPLLWEKYFNTVISSNNAPEMVNTVFDWLPPLLLEEVLERCTLKYGELKVFSYFECFATPSLRKFNFLPGLLNQNREKKLLFLVQNKCQRSLKDLSLKLCGMSVDEVTQTVTLFPRLEKLNLSHTNLDDESLEMITKTSPNLISLNIRGNSNITDKGLQILSKNVGKTLRAVIASKTCVTQEGAKAFARSCPAKILYAEDIYKRTGEDIFCFRWVRLGDHGMRFMVSLGTNPEP